MCTDLVGKVHVVDPVSAAAHQQCALTTLVIKRHIDLFPPRCMGPPSRDAVPISCRIYLSPTMPLGCYHSQWKEGKELWKQEERTGEMVLFVFLRQRTDGWAISGHWRTVQNLLSKGESEHGS